MRALAIFVLLALLNASSADAFDRLLPDPKLTPGKTATSPKHRRGVTPAMEQAVFARYRIPPERRDAYVLDHLIPLELGGADDIKNLWPQKRTAKPYGPHRKEILTRRFLALIADGRMTITEAQREMSDDWISAFVIHIGMVYLTPELRESSE